MLPAMTTGRSMELMAPAGGLDAGLAALRYGADAIYLGLPRFSARAEAANFRLEEVEAVTAFAHSLTPRRRVFAAVNTLVLDGELEALIEPLGTLADIGVDALIVQDLGVYRLARRHFPSFRLHASTQMAVHNRAGVDMLKDLGFHRATLARELTLEEIRDCAGVPDIETEVFIHGALCYAYSGLCLMSSHLTGRSGNRGRCAYLCRDRFEQDVGRLSGFLFNMKDLALPDQLTALRAAGVASVKIEGRMKSPLYVAATVNYYRRLLDGPVSPDERAQMEADIRSVFSRPWTALDVKGRRAEAVIDPGVLGHRGEPVGRVEGVARDRGGQDWLCVTPGRPIERHDGLQIDVPGSERPFGFGVDRLRVNRRAVFEGAAGQPVEIALPKDHPALPDGAPVYLASSQAVKRKYRWEGLRPGAWRARRALEVELSFSESSVRAQGRLENPPLEAVAEQAGPFEPARKSGTEQAVRGAFEKLGDTPFELRDVTLDNPRGLFVPVSRLNELRRDLVRELEARLAEARRASALAIQQALAPARPPPPADGARWVLKTDRIAHLSALEPADWATVDELVLEIEPVPAEQWMTTLRPLSERVGPEKIRLALPLITRAWEVPWLAETVARCRAEGWSRWEASGLASWKLVRENRDWTADWSVYVMNRAAAEQALDLGASAFTLSPEDHADNMTALLRSYGARATVIVYQDTPLFISEHCVRMASRQPCPGPASCDLVEASLESSHGDKLWAINRGCRMILVHRSPFCLADRMDRLKAAGARRLRADFVYRSYAPEQVVALWRQLRVGRCPAGARAANFDRGFSEAVAK